MIINIVKLNSIKRDIADTVLNIDVCTHYFDGPLPARTVIGVSNIPMGALVQVLRCFQWRGNPTESLSFYRALES
ncbi:hypothetical protein O9992_24325 [Vibrio lentus]|nr:hypothetical protein [Vibrio lentus]